MLFVIITVGICNMYPCNKSSPVFAAQILSHVCPGREPALVRAHSALVGTPGQEVGFWHTSPPPCCWHPPVDDAHLTPPLLMAPLSFCTHVLHQKPGLVVDTPPPLSMTHFGVFFDSPPSVDAFALSTTRRGEVVSFPLSVVSSVHLSFVTCFSEKLHIFGGGTSPL